MIDILLNNPFRILGVYTSATLRERTANATKIGKFQDVGKQVSFPADLVSILGDIDRNKDSVARATAQINLANDKIKYSLFWFAKCSNIDEIALNNLEAGNKEKFVEIASRQTDFSALLNLSVFNLIDGNYIPAIDYALTVIKDTEMRNQYVTMVCDNTVQWSETDLQQLYLDTLVEVLPANTVKQLAWERSKFSDIAAQFKSKAAQEPIDEINALVSQAKQLPSDDAAKNYEMGKRLMACAYTNLPKIKEVLGAKDTQYQMTTDSIALQLLQCGINYHNNTKDRVRTKVTQAFELQNFATTIALGAQAKKRCAENLAILKNKLATLPPKEIEAEAEQIEDLLEKFDKDPVSISSANTLLRNALPIMEECVKKVGRKNSAYLALSTNVVRSALSDVIDIVNQAQAKAEVIYKRFESEKSPFDDIMAQYGIGGMSNTKRLKYKADIEACLNKPLKEAWNATCWTDKFQLEDEYRTDSYLKNRSTLAKLCRNMQCGGYEEYSAPSFFWPNCVYHYRQFVKWVSEQINNAKK